MSLNSVEILPSSLRPKDDPRREEEVNKYDKKIFEKSENEGASDIY